MDLTKDHQDTLGELINIAFGTATATIAELFDNFATLHVPYINVTKLNNIKQKILEGIEPENGIYISSQNFFGNFHGEIFFFLDHKSASNMHATLWKLDKDVLASNDDIKGSILEICNIMTATCVGKLAEMLGTEITFSPPEIDEEVNWPISQYFQKKGYEYVISIETVLEFKDVEVLGKLCILSNESVFEWLGMALDRFLEEMLNA